MQYAEMSVQYKTITSNESGQRLDNFLIRHYKDVPKTHLYRLIRKGSVRINKKRAKPQYKLSTGDVVRIPPIHSSRNDPSQPTSVNTQLAERLKESILYQDDQLLVLNKPSGIAVHGGSGLKLGVIEALRVLYPNVHYFELVHRLDRDTSGCLLIAKKRSTLRQIQALFQEKKVYKQYYLLAQNSWNNRVYETVHAPLKKNILKSGERMVQIDDEQGKASETQFKLIENFEAAACCWLMAKPKTGRTHQIRVHAASLAHAIIGDDKYGSKFESPPSIPIENRLYLHAHKIEFQLDGKKYSFESEWNLECNKTIKALREYEVSSQTH